MCSLRRESCDNGVFDRTDRATGDRRAVKMTVALFVEDRFAWGRVSCFALIPPSRFMPFMLIHCLLSAFPSRQAASGKTSQQIQDQRSGGLIESPREEKGSMGLKPTASNSLQLSPTLQCHFQNRQPCHSEPRAPGGVSVRLGWSRRRWAGLVRVSRTAFSQNPIDVSNAGRSASVCSVCSTTGSRSGSGRWRAPTPVP